MMSWSFFHNVGLIRRPSNVTCLCSRKISRHAWRWDAYVGKFHMSSRDSTEQKVRVRQILMHPSYDIDTTENDIALLLLENPVHYNTHVSPICLPEGSKNRLRRGDVCVVAGWGETHGQYQLDMRSCWRAEQLSYTLNSYSSFRYTKRYAIF